jgi:ribosomal subunit interface protein
MQLTVTGKQVELGESLRSHVDASLGAILERYFKTAVEAHVVVTREAHLFRTDISLRIGRGIIVNAGATALDGSGAFDAAAERIAKQLRRCKRRLRAHHARARDAGEAGEWAQTDVPVSPIAEDPEPEAREDGGGPAVVAEMISELPSLTVSEAVTRMDLADVPVLLFRNRCGTINAVYRRSDGNIGWIDPDLDRSSRAASHRA